MFVRNLFTRSPNDVTFYTCREQNKEKADREAAAAAKLQQQRNAAAAAPPVALHGKQALMVCA